MALVNFDLNTNRKCCATINPQTRPVNVKSLQMIDQYRSWQRLDEEWEWFNFIFLHKGRVCPRASLSLWESIHTKTKSCSVSNEQTEYIYIHIVSDIRLNLWMVHKLVLLLHLQASHINSNPRELWHTYKTFSQIPLILKTRQTNNGRNWMYLFVKINFFHVNCLL